MLWLISFLALFHRLDLTLFFHRIPKLCCALKVCYPSLNENFQFEPRKMGISNFVIYTKRIAGGCQLMLTKTIGS